MSNPAAGAVHPVANPPVAFAADTPNIRKMGVGSRNRGTGKNVMFGVGRLVFGNWMR
jgi:hypothetical protein